MPRLQALTSMDLEAGGINIVGFGRVQASKSLDWEALDINIDGFGGCRHQNQRILKLEASRHQHRWILEAPGIKIIGF